MKRKIFTLGIITLLLIASFGIVPALGLRIGKVRDTVLNKKNSKISFISNNDYPLDLTDISYRNGKIIAMVENRGNDPLVVGVKFFVNGKTVPAGFDRLEPGMKKNFSTRHILVGLHGIRAQAVSLYPSQNFSDRRSLFAFMYICGAIEIFEFDY